MGESLDPDALRRRRFEELAEVVWVPLRRYCNRRADPADAEDLLAEVMLVLWRRLDDVPTEHVLPWTYKVAQNCLSNARRGRQRHLKLLQRLRDEPPPGHDQADERVAAGLERLREEEQEILRLWAWEGLEAQELAVVLECSANAAAVRLSRARAALREQLGKDPGDAGHTTGREEEVHGL